MQKRGAWGEGQACLFLERQGFCVLSRNFHTTSGEIDIVAEKGGDYYFIEVKTRRAGDMATDLAVTSTKLRRFRKAVLTYCYRHTIAEGSFIIASLMVVVDPTTKQVSFRLAAIY